MKGRVKGRHLGIGLFALLLLLGVINLLFLLFGGEYLARQVIPILPENSIYDEISDCFSQHSIECKDMHYFTSAQPQEVLALWPGPIDQFESSDGTTYYEYIVCNERWLGLSYAFFHKNHRRACAEALVYYDPKVEVTRIRIRTIWSVCPYIINEYFQRSIPAFRCWEG